MGWVGGRARPSRLLFELGQGLGGSLGTPPPRLRPSPPAAAPHRGLEALSRAGPREAVARPPGAEGLSPPSRPPGLGLAAASGAGSGPGPVCGAGVARPDVRIVDPLRAERPTETHTMVAGGRDGGCGPGPERLLRDVSPTLTPRRGRGQPGAERSGGRDRASRYPDPPPQCHRGLEPGVGVSAIRAATSWPPEPPPTPPLSSPPLGVLRAGPV